MKKLLIIVGTGITVCIVAVLLLFIGAAFFQAQRADYGWSPSIATPTFTATHPVVLFDEGHDNASSVGLAGRYWPFARLLRADGYAVESVPEGESLAQRPAGRAQGLALEYGKGRAVVLGERGMVTAHVSRRVRYGLNTSDNDNQQFVINVMRWLSRKI